MRPSLKASALFSLLTTVASLSAGPQRKSRPLIFGRRGSSAQRRQDVLAEVATPSPATATVANGSNCTSSDSNNRRTVVRPPMVDSNLLRFLGKQKRLQKQGSGQGEFTAAYSKDVGLKKKKKREQRDQRRQPLPLSLDLQTFSPTIGYLTSLGQENGNYNSTTTLSSSPPLPSSPPLSLPTTSPPPSTPPQSQALIEQLRQQLLLLEPQPPQSEQVDVLDSWLGQFNRYRVASMLRSNLVAGINTVSTVSDQDEALFMAAGERVQSQALARTSRRRVREFLKERDQAWTADSDNFDNDNNSISGSSSRTTATASSAAASISLAAAAENSERTAASTTVSTLTLTQTSTQTPPPPYGVQDVVDVMLSYGLTAKDIAEIFVHSPGIALMRPRPQQQNQNQTTATTLENDKEDGTSNSNGETLQETLDRVLVGLLCGTLKLRKYDARKVLRTCPGLLTMRGSRSAEQVIQLLCQLDVSTNSIARDKNALPTLLSRSPAALFRLIAFLASDAVRMPMNKIGPLLRRVECQQLLDVVAPVPVFEGSSDTNTDADVDCGDQVEKYNDGSTDPGVVSALFGRSSQVRRDRINQAYRNMTETAWTLRHELGTADLGKVVAAYPSVLLLDAEKKILPTARYLMNELGVWEDDLPSVLLLYPKLLGMKISHMERVASYLLELEVAPETLSSIFRAFPALLTLDIQKNMVPVVEFLQSKNISNVGRFISRLPPILGYSVANELQPKWEFLESVVTDARFELSRFPAYFSYPLERVTKNRFEYLRQTKRFPVQLMALDQVLRFGDKEFAVKVAGDKDHGVAYREFAQDRKKPPAAAGGKKPNKRRAPKKKNVPPPDFSNDNNNRAL